MSVPQLAFCRAALYHDVVSPLVTTDGTARQDSPWRGVIFLSGLVFVVLFSSEFVQGREADSRLLARYLGSICLVAAVGWVSLAIGLTFVGTRHRDTVTVTLAFLAGLGLWGLLVFFTGVVHGLYRSVLAVELLGLGLVFHRAVGELPQIGRRLVNGMLRAPRAERLMLLAVCAYAVILLVVSLGPVTAWDAVESHWAIARFFARHHAVPFPDFNGNGGTPQLVRMMFAAFSVFGFDHQASHAVWMFLPALFGMVYGVSRRFSSSVGAQALTLAATGLLVVHPQFSTQPVLDVPAFVFALGAVVAVLAPTLAASEAKPGRKLVGEGDAPRFFILAGFLTGCALATKWHVLAVVPVVIAGFLIYGFGRPPDQARRKTILWSAAAAALPPLVFAIYDLVHTGHPFWHPMIPLPWNPDYWSEMSAHVMLCRENVAVYRTRLCPSPLYRPLASLRWIAGNHALILPGLAFVPFALGRTRRESKRAAWVLFGGGMLCFLTPLLLLYAHFRHTMLGVGILILLIPLGWEAVGRRRLRAVLVVLLVVMTAALASKVFRPRRPQLLDLYFPAIQSVTVGPYFDHEYRVTYRYAATQWANVHLPRTARVVSDTRRLGNLDRDWMTIFPATQFVVRLSPETSAATLREALRKRGTTHLWVDQSPTQDTIGFPSLPDYLAGWRALVQEREWLTPVYADSLVHLYGLR